jgi:hypothetical protein
VTVITKPAPKTSRLQTAWLTAAKELDLEIAVPFELKTRNFSLTAQVLLSNFGGEHGMLIVSDYRVIEPFREQVIKLGYGFVTMAEPERDWPFTREEKEAFIEMLADWGWMGDPDEEPDWLALADEG